MSNQIEFLTNNHNKHTSSALMSVEFIAFGQVQSTINSTEINALLINTTEMYHTAFDEMLILSRLNYNSSLFQF